MKTPRLSTFGATRLALAGVAVLGLELWGINRPALWADEVATVSGARRSLGSLLSMLHNIDAVHGTYYLFMHFWVAAFGTSEFALRLPSAIAVALTSVVVYLIAKLRFDERVAWFAMLIAAVLPRLSWAATEARSYALAALLASLLLLLFLRVVEEQDDRRARRLWVAYTFVLALCLFLFVYIALMAAAQGLWLLRNHRQLFKRWITSVLISIAVASYLIFNVIYEKGQVGWLPPISRATFSMVFMGQAFWTNPELAFFANGLMLAVLAGAVHRSRIVSAIERSTLNLFAYILIVPTAVIVGFSLVCGSIYDSRYFTFSAPVVAITMAAALERLLSKRLAVASLAVVVALSSMSYLYFRSIDSKGTHWDQVAALVGKHAKAGDGILFTDFTRKSPSLSRLPIAYPNNFKGLVDVTKVKSFQHTGELYDKRESIAQALPRLKTLGTVLVLSDPAELSQYHQVDKLLRAAGFRPSASYSVYASHLYAYSR
ncbi:MAG: glycosyltransferase family 39 protein [Micrococcales bacterium]